MQQKCGAIVARHTCQCHTCMGGNIMDRSPILLRKLEKKFTRSHTLMSNGTKPAMIVARFVKNLLKPSIYYNFSYRKWILNIFMLIDAYANFFLLQEDLYYKHSFIQDLLWDTLNYLSEPIMTRWPFNKIRERAIRKTIKYMRYGAEETRYITIGCVEKVCVALIKKKSFFLVLN